MTEQQEAKKRGHHHGRFEEREDLAGEHRLGDIGQLILLLIFLTVWIGDSFILRQSVILRDVIPSAVRSIAGSAIQLFAGLLAWRGLSTVFGEERAEPAVIRDGVFGVVRHPIYLAAILVYVGFLAHALSLAAAGVFLVIVAFYVFIARHEEKLLLDKFGEDYRDYMREVGMFIPRLRRRGVSAN
ncbi:MAG: isoprenylcysteine carboxylmethyltransferase family protein [Anaerolineae bacterium]|nr:isoprenylcysteine carboxylmethyltransferase family protein [Anaerolineae bacterium]